MPIPSPYSTAAAIIPEAYKFYQGYKDMQLAKEFAKKKRPVLDQPIPEAILENVRTAKNLAGTVGVPGQGVIQNQIDAGTSSATNNLITTQQGGASTAAGIAALDANNSSKTAALGINSANLRLSHLADYMHQNGTLAPYQNDKFNKEWAWNERDPYLQSMAAASAFRNSGEQNQFSAINNLSSLAVSSLYGQSNNPTAASKVADINDYVPGDTPGVYPTGQGAIDPTGGNGVGMSQRQIIFNNTKQQNPNLSDEDINRVLDSFFNEMQ